MATKDSIIASITKATYSAKEVIHLISSVKLDPVKPPYIKKGDCFSERIGQKKRPLCVIKVVDNLAYCIPMTSTNNEMVLCEGKNPRFCQNEKGKSYFSKGLLVVPVEVVIENYLFSYENNAVVNRAIREMRKLMGKVL